MEEHVFPLPEVSGELKRFVEARLHMDRPGPNLARMEELQRKYTGVVTLPVYVLVNPKTEEAIAKLSGATSAENFIAFLRRATVD